MAEDWDVAASVDVPDERGHYVYVLRCGDGTLYTGYTTDVPRRVAEHAAGDGANTLAAERHSNSCTSNPTPRGRPRRNANTRSNSSTARPRSRSSRGEFHTTVHRGRYLIFWA